MFGGRPCLAASPERRIDLNIVKKQNTISFQFCYILVQFKQKYINPNLKENIRIGVLAGAIASRIASSVSRGVQRSVQRASLVVHRRFPSVDPSTVRNAIHSHLAPLCSGANHLLVEHHHFARRWVPTSQHRSTTVAGVDLQHGLVVEALFAFGVITDGGLHGTLEEDLVDLLDGRGLAAFLVLLLE
jgi:hypothetical protein